MTICWVDQSIDLNPNREQFKERKKRHIKSPEDLESL